MERQLKRDILEEAERMRSFAGHPHVSSSPDGSPDPSSLLGDRFLAADEDENGNLIAVWQAQVSKTTILTPQQAFLRCFEEVALSKQDGSTEPLDISRPRKNNQAALNSVTGANFKASYFRTPITDEQAPSPSTMNDIIMALETARDASNLVLVFSQCSETANTLQEFCAVAE